jgi:hypothetical protein
VLIQAGTRDRLSCFVPFDVSETALQQTARRLASEFRSLAIYAVVGSFGEHLDRLPRHGRQLVVFLGSTIGNFDDQEVVEFLGPVRRLLQPGDGKPARTAVSPMRTAVTESRSAALSVASACSAGLPVARPRRRKMVLRATSRNRCPQGARGRRWNQEL